MTGIAAGWTVDRSVLNRARRCVVEAIDHAAGQSPFLTGGSTLRQWQ